MFVCLSVSLFCSIELWLCRGKLSFFLEKKIFFSSTSWPELCVWPWNVSFTGKHFLTFLFIGWWFSSCHAWIFAKFFFSIFPQSCHCNNNNNKLLFFCCCCWNRLSVCVCFQIHFNRNACVCVCVWHIQKKKEKWLKPNNNQH